MCVQKFKTEYQPYTESKCTTEYKQVIERVEGKPQVCRTTFYNRYMSISSVPQYYLQDCQYAWKGTGNDKVWAPIEGTCQNVPYDSCKESRRPRLNRWPTRSAMMSPRRNVRLCRNKFASMCQKRCASRCLSSSAMLSTRSSRLGSADRRRRKFAKYRANRSPHHQGWHHRYQVFLVQKWRLCQPLQHQLLCRAHQLSTSSHLISSGE